MQIIANILNNHNGDTERAKKLIRLAASSGADVVEFHVFRRLFRDESLDNRISDYRLSLSDIDELVEEAHNHNVAFSLAPYEPDLLHQSADVFSLDSFNLTVTPLVKALANSDKRLLVGTCGWSNDEINEHIEPIVENKEASDVLFLYTSAGDELKLKRLLEMETVYVGIEILQRVNPIIPASSVLYGSDAIRLLFDDGTGIDARRSYRAKEIEQIKEWAAVLEKARDCGCGIPSTDELMRADRARDPSDYLRPIKK